MNREAELCFVLLNLVSNQKAEPSQAPQVQSLRAVKMMPRTAVRGLRQVTKAEGKLSVSDLKREDLEGKTVGCHGLCIIGRTLPAVSFGS